MYQLLKNILFQFDPEKVHYFSMNCLKAACNIGLAETLISRSFQYPSDELKKTVFGVHFNNPVGLGAGFDKNAIYLNELAALGFGFIEIGTVTPKAQNGNERPRLFRLAEEKALINRMGFNNDGVDAIKNRLINWHSTRTVNQKGNLIIGGNIGKNKITPNEDAWKDYKTCFNQLHEVVDYFVANVSSPNTPGLRELQEKDALRKIFTELQNDNVAKNNPKPLLLKIAPDLTKEQLDDIISVALEVNLSGLVATNTTIDRSMLNKESISLSESFGMGGLSGKPLQHRSTEVIQYLSQQTNGKLPIIASGGIFTGIDAAEKIQAGASLVQVWTGFVYEGPAIVKNICTYLAKNYS